MIVAADAVPTPHALIQSMQTAQIARTTHCVDTVNSNLCMNIAGGHRWGGNSARLSPTCLQFPYCTCDNTRVSGVLARQLGVWVERGMAMSKRTQKSNNFSLKRLLNAGYIVYSLFVDLLTILLLALIQRCFQAKAVIANGAHSECVGYL